MRSSYWTPGVDVSPGEPAVAEVNASIPAVAIHGWPSGTQAFVNSAEYQALLPINDPHGTTQGLVR